MKRRTATAVALVGISVSLLAQGPRRDGKWEVTTEMSMQGMPAGAMPPTTMTQCITKEEAADPQKAVPQPPAGRGGQAPSDCKMSDYKTEGSKVTYTMTCSTPQQIVMKGEMVGADKFDGTSTMNVAMGRGGQPMAMTMKMTGKRLGDCVK